jgi:hypothetical protein
MDAAAFELWAAGADDADQQEKSSMGRHQIQRYLSM